MLWKSVILTILICGLLILGASTIVAGQKDTGDADKPAGTIARPDHKRGDTTICSQPDSALGWAL